MKNDAKKKLSQISTPKKVALALLGALTLLTVVNLIEAGVHKFKDHNHIEFDEEAIHFEIDEDIHVHVDEHEFRSEHNGVKFHVRVDNNKEINVDGETMIDKLFDVSSGDRLSVRVGDADIRVQTHDAEEVHIEIYLEGKNMRKARAFFDEQRYEVGQDGSLVYIQTNPTKNNFSWDQSGGAHIMVDLTVPEIFNADIRTSDGDIVLSTMEGEVILHTSDGDISTQVLRGPSINIRTSDGDIQTSGLEAEHIHIRTSDGDIDVEDLIAEEEVIMSTSDGDIRANNVEGRSSISTSDGDIYMNSARGSEINLRTSDGEIVIEDLQGKSSTLRTSDGDIVLHRVSGALSAKTSGGNLEVALDSPTDVFLRTGDGNIAIGAPTNYQANLSLRGSSIRISSEFSFDGDIKENKANGKINGGGHTFEAHASDGTVTFREN